MMNDEFFLINPNRDEETWEAFSDLYPGNLDFAETTGILLGLVNQDGKAVGAMAVLEEPDTYNISWLYVEPMERRKGIASKLISAFLDFMEQTANFRQVEAYFSEEDENCREFFASLNTFDVDSFAGEYLISPEDIKVSKTFQKLSKLGHRLQPFTDLGKDKMDSFMIKMQEMGILLVADMDWNQHLVKDLSFVEVKDYSINGAILVMQKAENQLELSLLYSNDQGTTLALLNNCCAAFAANHTDCMFRITPINEASEKIVKIFFPKAEAHTKRYVAEWNYL